LTQGGPESEATLGWRPQSLWDCSGTNAVAVIVWDGQTVVLGPASVEVEDKSQRDAAGAAKKTRKSRGDATGVSKKIRKHLLVFVTPTIVDAAGNPVHSEEELPFRQNAVPRQKTGN